MSFLEKHFFSFLIITLVIYDLQKPTIPQIKAKDISFGPYFISFVTRINIFWDRKLWSCLIFFDSDFISIHSWINIYWLLEQKRAEVLKAICTKVWHNDFWSILSGRFGSLFDIWPLSIGYCSNHCICAKSETRNLPFKVNQAFWRHMRGPTQERSHISAQCVTRTS